MSKEYKFEAEIRSGGGGGAYVLFPYDIQKEFGVKGRVPVTTTIDGEPYTGSLVKYGLPQHMLPVLKGVREKVRKNVGDTVTVILKQDTTERTVEIPDDFKKALKLAKVEVAFKKMAYSHQKEYVKAIIDAKRPETRIARIEKAIEKIASKK